MALAIVFLGLLAHAKAYAKVNSKVHSEGTTHPQQTVLSVPEDEAFSTSAGRRAAGHSASFLQVQTGASIRHPEAPPSWTIAHNKTLEESNEEVIEKSQTHYDSTLQHVDRGTAVMGSIFAGFILGAVGGGSNYGPGGLSGAGRGAVLGACIGGFFGFVIELPSEEKWREMYKSDAEIAAKYEGSSQELPVPTLEKLHQLALTAVALSDYEESQAQQLGNDTERLIERAEEKKAVSALDDIVDVMNSTGKEPMNHSESDYEDIQEVLSEGDTAEYVTAEAAEANNAMVTANDLARMYADNNGSRLRAEDMGPVGDLKSFQGDMIPASAEQLLLFQTLAKEAQNSTRRGPQVAGGLSWTSGRVKYCFASDVSPHVRHLFLAACNQFHVAVGCIHFVDVGWLSGSSTSRESEQRCRESPAIFVQNNPAEGCYSYVGMVPQKQSQRLQLQVPGCLSIGTSLHELGHAIGMAHEQSRPDRDQHVRINWGNIKASAQHNFQVDNNGYAGEPYDFLSIMHYDGFAFANDPNQPTIEALSNQGHDGALGQRVGLSASDVKQVVAMYQGEVGNCKGNALAGLGCVDKPGDHGEDVCSIDKCNSVAAKNCCACGGGVQVQCYENQSCPKKAPLPALQAHECIEDATKLFAGQGYDCIYTNICDYNVEFKCPGFACGHKVRSKSYEAAMCNNQYQTQICRAKSECTVWKI